METQWGPGGHEPLRPGEARRTFSLIGWGLFALVGVQWVGVNALVSLFLHTSPGIFSTSWWMWFINYVPLYLMGFPALLLVWRLIPHRPAVAAPAARLSAGLFWKLGAACYAVTIALNQVSTAFAALLARLKSSGEIINPLGEMLQGGNPWLTLLMVVGVAPVMEELIFRHLLHKKLRCFGDRVYLLVSAVMFAAIHQNIFQMLYAFVLGAVFAYTVCRTGTARYAVLLHMLVNFFGGGASHLVLTYGNEGVQSLFALGVLALLAGGIVSLILWGLRRPRLLLLPGRFDLPSRGVVFLNSGVLAFLGLTLFFTVRTALL